MGNVTATVSVQDQSGPTPLDNVLVRVFEADGTTFVTEGTTGAPFASGEVEFTLNGELAGEDYVIRLHLDGWRFPSGATQTISVTDPPNPDNDFGPYDALEGSDGMLVTVAVKDSQVTPQDIDDVLVRIYDSPADSFLARGMTGQGAEQDGEATFILPGAAAPGTEYIIRLSKAGVEIANGATQTISVLDPVAAPDSNIFDFTGSVAVPESNDPDMCRISGVLTDVSLRPIAGRVVEFKPFLEFPEGTVRLSHYFPGDPTLVRQQILLAAVKAISDSQGRVDVELPRGGVYDVMIHGFENPMVIREPVTIPDQAALELADLLYPYVSTVSYGTDPINVAADESIEVVVTVHATNGQQIETCEQLDNLLEFTVGDDDIATVELTDDGTLTVTGVGSGTTTIEVERKEGTVAPRRPAASSITVTPATVVVT